MKNTFKPWLHPVEPKRQAVLHLVTGVARELSVPIMLLGAFARELHFYHQYGIPCARRTRDIDFSIQVPDWEAYEAFRARLKKQGFLQRESRHPEKRMHPETGQEIDLLPFGEISNEAEQIIWPTDNSPWSVVGFEEAFQTSLTCVKPETYLKLSGYLTDQVSGQSRMNLIRGMKEFSAHPTYPLARNRVKDVLLGMQSGKH